MAVEIGTATDHLDLLDKLITFLTTDSGLTGQSPSQAWEVMRREDISASDVRVTLRGPGLNDADNIFINIKTVQDLPGDVYSWEHFASTNYDEAEEWEDQPGRSSSAFNNLANFSISYWFIANGRRFIMVAKVSTIYSTYYGGLILPIATPSEYGYPIVDVGDYGILARWSLTSNASFFKGISTSTSNHNGYVRSPGGLWRAMGQAYSSSKSSVWPWDDDYTIGFLRNTDEGDYYLLPSILTSPIDGCLLGFYEGVSWVSGYNNAVENLIDDGSDDHLVVQSQYRTGIADYAAIKLV